MILWASSTCEIRISTNTLTSKSMTERKQRAKNERQRKRIKGTEGTKEEKGWG